MANNKLLLPICMIFFFIFHSASSSCGVLTSQQDGGDALAHNTSLLLGFSFFLPSDNKFSQDGPIILASPNNSFFLTLTSCQLLILHNDTGAYKTPIWDATFPHCSSSSSHSLSLQQDGNLVVTSTSPNDGSPAVIWSTGTSGRGVESVQLMDSGNLVLLTSLNVPIWQSFDHPSSYLISGQRLQEGMSLSLDYRSLMIEPNRAVLYANDNGEPQPYWTTSMLSNSSVAYAALDGGNLQLFDSNSNALLTYQTFNNSYSLWRAQLTPTQYGPEGYRHGGNLEIYYWSMIDGWHFYSQAIANLCDYPDACPHYGTCDPATQQCSCDSPMVSTRCGCDLPIQSSHGRQVEPNFCSADRPPKRVRFSELGNTSYFPLQHGAFGYNVSYIECKSYCLQNCSCAAFVYQNDLNSCYPIHESDDAIRLTFLRVDNSQSSVYIRTSSAISSLASITVMGLILSITLSSMQIFNLL